MPTETDSSSCTLELLFQYKIYHTGEGQGVQRAPRWWVPQVPIGSSQQNPWSSTDKRPPQEPPILDKLTDALCLDQGQGRQVLGAGASRNPAPHARGCPPFLHQRYLCAQTSPHAASNDCTDQIQAHQPSYNMYSLQQQRNWGKRRAHSHRTRRELNSDQSNMHKVAQVWSARGWGLETINTQPGPGWGGLGYYPVLNRDTMSDRNVQNRKQWCSLINWSAAASVPSC